MNTTTNTTHADRYFAPEARYHAPAARYLAPEARYFAAEARYLAPEARYFAPEAGVTESLSCSPFPTRLAGPAPGPARPGVGWLRLA